MKMHRDGYGPAHPAVNVKFYGSLDPQCVRERFGVPLKRAEEILQTVFEAHQADFWDTVLQIAADTFGPGTEVYSEGRSGGWAVVHGLPDDPEEWDETLVYNWERFERDVLALMRDLTSWDSIIETIEANDWAAPEEQDADEVTTRYQESLAGMR
jgi:hypothetical protein